MQNLNLPDVELRLRQNENGKQSVYDFIRRRWVALTPEEWVRQHLIHYAVFHLKYPEGRIAVEKSLGLLGRTVRADIVVFGSTGNPMMILECKAPQVKLSTEVFAQAARYNLKMKVPFLIISNGLDHYCAKINLEQGNYHFLEKFPDYTELM